MVRFGLASAGVAFGIVGACTFPDPQVDPDGDGGAPSSTSTSIVGSSSGDTPTSSSTVASSSSSSSSSVGGASSSSSSADGGGGAGGSTSSNGGGGEGGEGVGAGTSIVTGVGGGVTDIMCDNGCIPFPDDGSGGSGGGGAGAGGEGDCDEDGVPNSEDCQPCNADVFPSQPAAAALHSVGYEVFGERDMFSFDYDCNGVAEFEYGYSPIGCSALPETAAGCNNKTLYSGGANPVCGETHFVQDCVLTASLLETNCSNEGEGSNMIVRCR
jgi:hypothetical protein